MKGISLSGGVVVAILLVATAIFFDGGGTVAEAQEAGLTPSEVARMEFRVRSDDTCWDLAILYAGSGGRCFELIAANTDRLTDVGYDDPGLEAGMILNVPVSWFTGFLRLNQEHQVWITPFAQTPEDTALMASDQDSVPAGLITGLALGSLVVLAIFAVIYVVRDRVWSWIQTINLLQWPPILR